jgi:hypothetical protein
MFGPPKIVTARYLSREDYDWLPFDIAQGSVFYLVQDKWGVCTDYGVAASLDYGVAASLDPGGEPYFELPSDAVYKFVGYIHSLN